MIKLELLEACQNCPDFDPIKTKAVDFMYEGEVVKRDCAVTCMEIDRCKELLEYLQKEVKKNGN